MGDIEPLVDEIARDDAGALCPRCAGERMRMYRPGSPEQRLEVTSPEAAADILTPLMDGLDREHCVTLNLDTRHRLLAATTVSIGSVDHTFMSPRGLRDALLQGASAIVVAHNHPSGDAAPSLDDEAITRRLGAAGELVGVEVLDHLVIGHERWTSLARRGVLMNDLSQARAPALQRDGTRRR